MRTFFRAEFSFQPFCIQTHDVAEYEVQHDNRCVDFKRIDHCPVVDGISCTGQVHDADDVHQSRVLEGRDEHADKGREHLFEGLRQDDLSHGLKIAETRCLGCFHLTGRDVFDTSTDCFGDVCTEKNVSAMVPAQKAWISSLKTKSRMT